MTHHGGTTTDDSLQTKPNYISTQRDCGELCLVTLIQKRDHLPVYHHAHRSWSTLRTTWLKLPPARLPVVRQGLENGPFFAFMVA